MRQGFFLRHDQREILPVGVGDLLLQGSIWDAVTFLHGDSGTRSEVCVRGCVRGGTGKKEGQLLSQGQSQHDVGRHLGLQSRPSSTVLPMGMPKTSGVELEEPNADQAFWTMLGCAACRSTTTMHLWE